MMNKIFLIYPVCFVLLCCSDSSRQVEKEYIKNLEEKNKILEQEIADLKQKTKTVKPIKVSNTKGDKYFKLGSTKNQVLKVMGNPDKFIDLGFTQTMYFNGNTVEFRDGKVIGYKNYDGSLKVKLID